MEKKFISGISVCVGERDRDRDRISEKTHTYGYVFGERDKERDRDFLPQLTFPNTYLYKSHKGKLRLQHLFDDSFGNRPLVFPKCLNITMCSTAPS